MQDTIKDEKVYRFNYYTGKMEAIPVAPKLERGQIIYAYGYGMNTQMFAVYDQENFKCVEINRHPVNSIEDLPDDYFSAIRTYDDRILPVSKKYGIGLYYADNGEKPATEKQIEDGLHRANQIELFTKLKAEADEKAMIEAQQEARKKYGRILTDIRSLDYSEREKQAVKNLRAFLRYSYPSVKFTVHKMSSSWYYVGWTDGPKESEIKEITMLFDDSCRDKYNDDIWTNNPTVFTSVFGSVDSYVERTISGKVMEEIVERLNGCIRMDYSYQKFDRCGLLNAAKDNIPSEWRETIMKSSVVHPISIDDWSRVIAGGISFAEKVELTEMNPEMNPKTLDYVTIAEHDGVRIIEYSEKAIAVVGDTKRYAAKFKEMYGKFSYHLRCGAGWIFSKKKTDELITAISC